MYNDIRVQFVWVDSDLELTRSRNFYMCAWEVAVAHVCGGQRQPQVVPGGGAPTLFSEIVSQLPERLWLPANSGITSMLHVQTCLHRCLGLNSGTAKTISLPRYYNFGEMSLGMRAGSRITLCVRKSILVFAL